MEGEVVHLLLNKINDTAEGQFFIISLFVVYKE